MPFSVGVLYSTQDFLEKINEGIIQDISFTKIWKKYLVASSKNIFETALQCNWIRLIGNTIVLTDTGHELITIDSYEERLRYQIVDLIELYRPTWAMSIPYGRKECVPFMPLEVQQCFREAGLFGKVTPHLVSWWDKMGNRIRGYKTDKLLELGRLGEKLTITHEINRTGFFPQWISIETNKAGYDILSQTNSKDSTPLAIEVKTCSNPKKLTIYLTPNEWALANSSRNFLLYIWLVTPKAQLRLFQLTSEVLEKHLPTNNNLGLWNEVQINLSIEAIISYEKIPFIEDYELLSE